MNKYALRRVSITLVAVNVKFSQLLGALRTNRRKCFEYAFSHDLTPVESKIIRRAFSDPETNKVVPGAFEYAYVLECRQ